MKVLLMSKVFGSLACLLFTISTVLYMSTQPGSSRTFSETPQGDNKGDFFSDERNDRPWLHHVQRKNARTRSEKNMAVTGHPDLLENTHEAPKLNDVNGFLDTLDRKTIQKPSTSRNLFEFEDESTTGTASIKPRFKPSKTEQVINMAAIFLTAPPLDTETHTKVLKQNLAKKLKNLRSHELTGDPQVSVVEDNSGKGLTSPTINTKQRYNHDYNAGLERELPTRNPFLTRKTKHRETFDRNNSARNITLTNDRLVTRKTLKSTIPNETSRDSGQMSPHNVVMLDTAKTIKTRHAKERRVHIKRESSLDTQIKTDLQSDTGQTRPFKSQCGNDRNCTIERGRHGGHNKEKAKPTHSDPIPYSIPHSTEISVTPSDAEVLQEVTEFIDTWEGAERSVSGVVAIFRRGHGPSRDRKQHGGFSLGAPQSNTTEKEVKTTQSEETKKDEKKDTRKTEEDRRKAAEEDRRKDRRKAAEKDRGMDRRQTKKDDKKGRRKAEKDTEKHRRNTGGKTGKDSETRRKTEKDRRKTEEDRRRTEEDRRKTVEDRRKTEKDDKKHRRKTGEKTGKDSETRRKMEKDRRKTEEDRLRKSGKDDEKDRRKTEKGNGEDRRRTESRKLAKINRQRRRRKKMGSSIRTARQGSKSKRRKCAFQKDAKQMGTNNTSLRNNIDHLKGQKYEDDRNVPNFRNVNVTSQNSLDSNSSTVQPIQYNSTRRHSSRLKSRKRRRQCFRKREREKRKDNVGKKRKGRKSLLRQAKPRLKETLSNEEQAEVAFVTRQPLLNKSTSRKQAAFGTLNNSLKENASPTEVPAESCPENRTLSSPDLPLNVRSVCPWSYYIDHDPDRFPQDIAQARCRCTACLDTVTNRQNYNYACVPVTIQKLVRRRKKKKAGGGYRYQDAWEDVVVGCTCVTPRYSP